MEGERCMRIVLFNRPNQFLKNENTKKNINNNKSVARATGGCILGQPSGERYMRTTAPPKETTTSLKPKEKHCLFLRRSAFWVRSRRALHASRCSKRAKPS
jgi:hypothetical protein